MKLHPFQDTVDNYICSSSFMNKEIKHLENEVNELCTVCFAYTSKFLSNTDGEPDISSIHEIIRRSKTEVATLKALIEVPEKRSNNG